MDRIKLFLRLKQHLLDVRSSTRACTIGHFVFQLFATDGCDSVSMIFRLLYFHDEVNLMKG